MSFTPRLLRSARPLLRLPLPGTTTTLLQHHARSLPPLTPQTRSYASSGGLTNLFDAENMSDPARPRLQVAKLNHQGFHLSDGLIIPGGVIFLDDRAFLWDVDPVAVEKVSGRPVWREWSVERFKVFETVLPRPEILLLGTGSTVLPPPPELRSYISSLGIQLDVMDSRNACSTFNLLAEEGRTMAAALMPLRPIEPRTGERR
ncbi:hypothetical protein FFLO_00659 [Filobasidium floriforme]|uniref:NADH dehydrogenase [ubiquinone] 1 alpha subcomplex assembly factor 3 n=1 Tax=Filobasidium floriforme TaxID=5210 RepID=A0A8K0JR83_9TREE|nr:hypothetical protein FFLO_00659 [Filobasidium floriforme]